MRSKTPEQVEYNEKKRVDLMALAGKLGSHRAASEVLGISRDRVSALIAGMSPVNEKLYKKVVENL